MDQADDQQVILPFWQEMRRRTVFCLSVIKDPFSTSCTD